MKKRHQFSVLMLAGVVATCATAETLVMGKAGNGENAHSFYLPTDWIKSDGTVINSAPTSGNDYIVANGYMMNVNTTTNFAGDSLQFGYVGGNRGIFFQTSHNKTVTVNRLILANGLYRVWQDPKNASMSYLKGSIEVLSPNETPFRICPTHDGVSSPTGYDITWASDISGAVGTGLLINRIAPLKDARIVFSGDNSAYFGKIAVEGTNLTFEATSASALGGRLPVLDGEALTIDNMATFECSAASETLESSVNRGIKIKSGGAAIKVGSGKSLRIEWPVAIEGNFEKSGDGSLTMDSVTVADNVFFSISGGLLTMNVNRWPVAERFSVKAQAVRGSDIPFLKVPVSAGEVKPSDFTLVEDFASKNFVSCQVVVLTEGDWQIARFRPATVISPAEEVSVVYAVQSPEGWTDGKVVHSLGDYHIDAKAAGRDLKFSVGDLASVVAAVLEYSMPQGTSLTFTGDTSSKRSATWLIRQKVFTGDVRAVGQKISFVACGNTKPASLENVKYNESRGDIHVLRGRMHVENTEAADGGLKFQTSMSRTVNIESVISGAGTISLQPYNVSGVAQRDKVGTYVFSGTNSFEGKIHIHSAVENGTDSICTLRFGDECNLGPGPKTGTADIYMQAQKKANVAIYPIGSVDVSLPNRRFYFNAGSNIVKVDEGEVFELYSPVAFRNGTSESLTYVRKTGKGIWAIGGNVEYVQNTATSLVWTLNVDEGYIRAYNARAFSGMTVTFADGAGIAAKYDPGSALESAQYGMIVTNAALFAVSGAKLPVKIDTNGDSFFNKRLPVLTVPAGAADSIGAKLKGITDIPMGSVSFVRDSVALGDKDYVRFSAEIHRGTVIMFR